jgi:hypothetical protein
LQLSIDKQAHIRNDSAANAQKEQQTNRDYHLITGIDYIESVRLFTKARKSGLGFQSSDVRLSIVSPRL